MALILDNVPAELPAHAEWTIEGVTTREPLTVSLRAVPVTATRLHVTYQDASVPPNASGPAGTENGVAYAVVDPTLDLDDGHSNGTATVINEATLSLPPSTQTWTYVREDQHPYGSGWRHLIWCAQQVVPGIALVDDYGALTGVGRRPATSAEGRVLVRSARIRFAVPKRSTAGVPRGRVVVRLVLRLVPEREDAQSESNRDMEHARCQAGEPIAVFPELELARTSRSVSVPLPLVHDDLSLIELECGTERTHGQDDLIAPMNCDLDECVVRYSGHAGAAADRLDIFERQRFRVSVHDGDGNELRAIPWEVNPAESSVRRLALDAYSTTEFEVRVRVLGSPQAVRYRQTTSDGESAEADTRDYEWRARVHPRGLFGVGVPLRALITIPVIPVAVRLPAVTRNLESSMDTSSIEAISVTTGVLIGLEAWNYEERQNWFSPLNLRLGAGLLLFAPGEEVFTPSFIYGASITLPLIDSPSQLGTSLSVSVFGEYEVRGKGHHLLIALSLDVLSLFSPNTDG